MEFHCDTTQEKNQLDFEYLEIFAFEFQLKIISLLNDLDLNF